MGIVAHGNFALQMTNILSGGLWEEKSSMHFLSEAKEISEVGDLLFSVQDKTFYLSLRISLMRG